MVTLHSPDLDIKKIAESGQCFRMDETGAGHYTLVAMGHVLEMDALPGGCVLHCTVKQYEEIWKAYFDMETDYAAFRAAIPASDGFLTKAAEAGRGNAYYIPHLTAQKHPCHQAVCAAAVPASG